VVMPVGDLDEAVKEVKLLREHEEESSQKIIELEALCKRLREDAQKQKEEKATLEGMIQSHDGLIMEMTEEYGLNCMGENVDDEDEDDDDEGNAAAPPAPTPPAAAPEVKYSLCKHKCFRPCSRPWSPCMLNPKRHRQAALFSCGGTNGC
jgi:hypothetical protein